MNAPTIIVGGGIAGAVAAATLARAGERPLVLERSRGPQHKVCGEFLSWEAADRIATLGFDLAALAPARIDRVRLVRGERYAEARLPRAAYGISRFALDDALLAHAARLGARVERGAVVRSLDAGDGLRVDGRHAGRVFVATGKHDLRGARRAVAGQHVVAGYVGFKAHFRLTSAETAALAGAVELHLLPGGGYAGLQLVERGIANLCLLTGTGTSFVAMRGAIDAGAAMLARRLAGAEMLFDRPLAIAGVPYGFIHRGGDPPWQRRIGDQFAVVHSFTGDGMAMAVATAALAAAGADDAALRRAVAGPVRTSALLHASLAHAAPFAAARLCPALLTVAARLTRVRG